MILTAKDSHDPAGDGVASHDGSGCGLVLLKLGRNDVVQHLHLDVGGRCKRKQRRTKQIILLSSFERREEGR